MNKLLIILLACFSFFNSAFSQTGEINAYVEDNKKVVYVHDIDTFSDFNFLDKEIARNRLFIVGELHYIRCQYPIQIKLSKYLFEKGNVRYFFIEHSPGVAYFIRKYIETKDISILNMLSLKYGYNLEYYYNFARAFIDKKDQITIVGIDVIFDKILELEALLDILESNENINNELINLKDYITQMIENSTIDRDYNILQQILRNEISENILEHNNSHFHRIINSIIRDEEKSYLNKDCHLRDKIMFNNINNFIKLNNDANYFLSIGVCHLVKGIGKTKYCDKQITTPLLGFLLEDQESVVKDSLLSFVNYFSHKRGGVVDDRRLKKTLNKTIRKNNEFIISTNNKKTPFSKNLQFNDYLIILNGRDNKFYSFE